MVNSKKLLSLFLAVVMAVSSFAIMASAYTVGPEVAGNINVKYTVEKVDLIPETDEGSEEYEADNLYAVDIWMQCDNPVYVFIAPIHFDKTLFAPVLNVVDGITKPHGEGMDVDTYYTDEGEGAVYAYVLGDYMNNTSMYDENGAVTTKKGSAKCIGLGNKNSAGIDIVTELVSPDHPLYSKWGVGLPENTGVMYLSLNVASKTKSAYLNTVDGNEASKEWIKMGTFYFEALVDDVAGAEFGVYTEDCFTVDGDIDASGYGYFAGATTAQYGSNPNKNVVSNAKIEAAVEYDLKHIENQWRNSVNYEGAYDVGVKFGFDVSDINIQFEEGGTRSTNVARVGAKIYDANGDEIPGPFESEYVYEVGTEYHYRVILEGLAKDDTTEYTITPYLVYTDESLDVVYGETVTVRAIDVIPQ